MTPERLAEIKTMLAKTFPCPSEMIQAREAAKELLAEVERLGTEQDQLKKDYDDCCKYANGWRERADGWMRDLYKAEAKRDALQLELDKVIAEDRALIAALRNL